MESNPEVKKEVNKIDQLIRSMKFLTRYYRNQCHTHYYEMIYKYYEDLRDARQNGDFVVAHTIFFPVEIFHAMDLKPMHLEFTGYMLSLFGISCNDVLAKAAEMGLAPEICSGHRLVEGAAGLNMLPRSDAVVCSNMVCDNGLKTGELIMEYHDCPGFIFDYPFHQNEAGQKFVIQELKAVIEFLEQVSGHKMNWTKLADNIAETDKQLDLIRQINGLCKKVPSPFQPQDFLKFLCVDYMGAGKVEITRYLTALRDDLAKMVAAGKGFSNPERLRLMGLMIPPWYLQGDIDSILQQHGAAIVCYPNLCDWGEETHLDPEKPLESLARKLAISPPMRTFGPLDERALNPLIKGVKEYHIDGAINFCHLGCRQMGPTLKIFKDVLDEQNVPVLNIDCDLVDATITTADEVRQKLEQFFEQLEDR
jgi:benzoyl-CoA reductase/2-hydroxyglutaryl-CoA dehydratase subunit BcrC/BadD/HgdB